MRSYTQLANLYYFCGIKSPAEATQPTYSLRQLPPQYSTYIMILIPHHMKYTTGYSSDSGQTLCVVLCS